jgi:hypothetical protein
MDRVFYAPFAKALDFNPSDMETIQGLIKQSYGTGVSAGLFHGIGYLGPIRSPYLALVQKSFSLISFTRRQRVLKSMVQFMQAEHPEMIVPAERYFNGSHMEFREINTGPTATVYVLEGGKPAAYYIPKEFAEQFSSKSPDEMELIKFVNRVVSVNKSLITELNPGFWALNMPRDIGSLVVNVPGGWKALRYFPEAYRAARDLVTLRPNARADQALAREMVISRANYRDESLGDSTEVGRALARFGQSPVLMRKVTEDMTRFQRILRALAMGWRGFVSVGKTLERTTKIAAMMHMDKAFPNMPEWQKQRMVVEMAGSPDFLERGRLAWLMDTFMLFYNPFVQGIHSSITAAKANPKKAALKYSLYMGAPALALWLFENGFLSFLMPDDLEHDLREKLLSIPENDKRRGWVIPLWWSDYEQRKVAYLVLPMAEQLRAAHIALRGWLQGISGGIRAAGKEGASAGDVAGAIYGRTPVEGLRSSLAFGVQDVPGMNPFIDELIIHTRYWVAHQNPFDSHTGRQILDTDTFEAKEGGGELLKRSVSRLGAGILYRYRKDNDIPTTAEKVLNKGIVSNTLGRFFRVSNRGRYEQIANVVDEQKTEVARMHMAAKRIVRQAFFGELDSVSKNDQRYMADPGFRDYVLTQIKRIPLLMTSPEERAMRTATKRERMAIMREVYGRYAQRQSEEEAAQAPGFPQQ